MKVLEGIKVLCLTHTRASPIYTIYMGAMEAKVIEIR